MNLSALYLIIAAILIYFVIKIATFRRTESVNLAFAGTYDGTDIATIIPKDRNNTIYTEGENVIDLSKYDKFLISGHSLEKEGLPNGCFVYTEHFNDKDLSKLYKRFVIYKYDINRLLKEHPEADVPVGAHKARKVITIIEAHLSEALFKEQILKILSTDDDIKDIDKCAQRLWEKYDFASGFYEDKELIVSITYKDGECKDYSFHSVNFLAGVVKYKSIS